MINLSERFISIQGEGPYTGFPALFLRVAGCVLNCEWCDTKEVWKKVKESYDPEQFYEMLQQDYGQFLQRPNVRIILTGGDPMMYQAKLAKALSGFRSGTLPAVDVETEGVIKPIPEFAYLVSTFVVSPKLSNSGQPPDKAIVTDTLWEHVYREDFFKFAVRTDPEEMERDIEEIITLMTFVAGDVPWERIYLMPIASTREELEQGLGSLVRAATRYGFLLSNRMQVQIWDKTTGV